MPAPTIEVLQNGDFEQAPSVWNGQSWIIVTGLPGGWTGNDIEWVRQSNDIGGPNPSNWVIEMDGNGSPAVTQVSQSFTIGGRVNAILSFDMALRSGRPISAGEGFTLVSLDSFGNRIQPILTYTPTLNAWTTVTLTVPFTTPGIYPIRFTEIGPNNSLGAIIDDVSLLVCFTAGTLIDTPDGPRRVEDLRVGDLVLTADDGPQPILWVGRRTVRRKEMLHDPRLRPVIIAAGAFGAAMLSRDLAVSRQHRILMTG